MLFVHLSCYNYFYIIIKKTVYSVCVKHYYSKVKIVYLLYILVFHTYALICTFITECTHVQSSTCFFL